MHADDALFLAPPASSYLPVARRTRPQDYRAYQSFSGTVCSFPLTISSSLQCIDLSLEKSVALCARRLA